MGFWKDRKEREISVNDETPTKLIVNWDNNCSNWKTNSFRSMRKVKYMTMVEEHPIQSSGEIYRVKVAEIFEDEKLLVDAIGFIMSKYEVVHINEWLKTKAIPIPKLLIKDHKKLTFNGGLPTLMVIIENISQLLLQKWVTWVWKAYCRRMRLIIQDLQLFKHHRFKKNGRN